MDKMQHHKLQRHLDHHHTQIYTVSRSGLVAAADLHLIAPSLPLAHAQVPARPRLPTIHFPGRILGDTPKPKNTETETSYDAHVS